MTIQKKIIDFRFEAGINFEDGDSLTGDHGSVEDVPAIYEHSIITGVTFGIRKNHGRCRRRMA
ncbi:MAG: hypothetical protein A2144_13520 [Chloroflexi bacterium RBG_16_50_9]|nr:MAG: hypothetical protein A2144_13520 [Chloroflexi bacterium RBG_16_50_9]